MSQESWNQTLKPGRIYRAPVVTIFFVVSLILWLIAPSGAGAVWRDLRLHFGSPSVEGFLVSHLFHENGIHLVLNVLIIVVIGMLLESRWGTARFLAFYLLCAWGGTALTILWARLFGVGGYTCGASSVALGCLITSGFLYPDISLWRWMPPNRYLVWIAAFIGSGLLVLMQVDASASAADSPFFLPQIVGIPLALLFLFLLPHHNEWLRRRQARREDAARRRVREIRHRVDELLEKISIEGYDSLSRDELNFLRNASKHFSDGE